MAKRKFARVGFGIALLLAFALPGMGDQDENPVVTFVRSKVKDPTAPLALVATFRVKAGMEEAFERAFAPCVRATRKEPGSIAYDLNRDSEDPSIYVVYERWKNLAAVTEHARQPHFVAMAKALAPLLDGEELKVLQVRD